MSHAVFDRGLNRTEVMAILGISQASFYRLIAAGKLKAYRINVAYRVRASEVERFRQEHEA